MLGIGTATLVIGWWTKPLQQLLVPNQLPLYLSVLQFCYFTSLLSSLCFFSASINLESIMKTTQLIIITMDNYVCGAFSISRRRFPWWLRRRGYAKLREREKDKGLREERYVVWYWGVGLLYVPAKRTAFFFLPLFFFLSHKLLIIIVHLEVYLFFRLLYCLIKAGLIYLLN